MTVIVFVLRSGAMFEIFSKLTRATCAKLPKGELEAAESQLQMLRRGDRGPSPILR